jgi:hypothetical protein
MFEIEELKLYTAKMQSVESQSKIGMLASTLAEPGG